MAGVGGNTGGGGGGGGGADESAGGGSGPLGGTATRPQVGNGAAANLTVLKYLEKCGVVTAPQVDPWDPTAGVGDVSALTPKYTVDMAGTYKTVQSAIDAAKAEATSATDRVAILVNECTFTADDATTAGSIHLGRAWDESGKDVATYATLVASGVYPNGQALVRGSTLGAHIRAADPWAEAATTKRPFSTVAAALPANRLYEFGNTGPGAAK